MGNQVVMVAMASALALCCAGAMAADSAPLDVSIDNPGDSARLVQAYNAGSVLVFDLSVDQQKEQKKELMSDISGMTIGDNKVVYMRRGPEGAKFLVLEKDLRADRKARSLEKFRSAEAIKP